jgi:glycolate oxidase
VRPECGAPKQAHQDAGSHEDADLDPSHSADRQADRYSRRERDIAKRHQRRRVRVDGARVFQARQNWRDVERYKSKFDIPLILKGIATVEDAKRAVELGVDCVYVSNHGGRQLDHGLGSIVVLAEIVAVVGGRARIIVDGGISRVTDVVKR